MTQNAHTEAGSSFDEIGAALELARLELDMDVAFLAEIQEEQEVLRRLAGDGASFGVSEGFALPLSDTYCNLMLEGRLPSAVPDARVEPAVRHLRITEQARIGAYLGVPLEAGDARRYTLCCLAHESRPALEEADVRFMRGVGETVLSALARHPA
jgi:GAF domain-containing protein